mgnify:CR=1 FL=1
MTVIESLYEYFNACPLLQDGKLNVNFLPADQREYTIDVTPIAEIVKRYIDGSSIRQYAFVIASRTFYSPDVSEALVNCGGTCRLDGAADSKRDAASDGNRERASICRGSNKRVLTIKYRGFCPLSDPVQTGIL